MHGAGNWVQINSETEKKLNRIQCWFARFIFQVGPGSPVSALLWDTYLLNMQYRIWREKVMLVMHIRDLEKETLASKIYQEQKKKGGQD